MDEIEELGGRNCSVPDEDSSNALELKNMQTARKTSVKEKRKRKLRSPAWNFFERLQEKTLDGKARCKCKKCGAIFICDSKYGTGNLIRHSKNCVRRDTCDDGQMLLDQNMSTREDAFDAEKFLELLVAAIIMHDLPLSFVEFEGVRAAFSYLREDVPCFTRNDVEAQILKMYDREKDRVKCMLKEVPGRICLTFDLWTSINTDGYLSLTAHFIDRDWILQKRVLSFSFLPPPYIGVALSEKINVLLAKWGMENKLFSMTLDNALSNDAFVEMLRVHLDMKKALVGNGEFFHLNCCAHVLDLIVHDGFKEIDEAIQKVRESVKYVKGSQVQKQKFLECVNLFSLDTKKELTNDVPAQWNSTFLMLESALFYRQAFCHLELSDLNFKSCPCKDDWEKIEKIVNLLMVFYEIACIFSSTKYPTSNLYFPSFFVARYTLQEHMSGNDEYLKVIARKMFEKFEKYWSELSVILAIAVILDPRYKMEFVDWSYIKLYGHGSKEFRRVEDKLFSLFGEYSIKICEAPFPASTSGGKNHFCSVTARDVFEEFDKVHFEEYGTSSRRTELQRFLDEPRFDRNSSLDILAFWKENQFRYPGLSKMAHDVLSIPISTVASKSAFCCDGRVLNRNRSALKPKTLEAIVCVKDWLYGEFEETSSSEHEEDCMSLDIQDDL